ncbi:MAG: hypothetical protein KDC88_01930 [Ignavibacteriae bacterium]|nr:hypothetical protein [Ignavibacteriota bacterium]MCB9207744.1 hypothetical protein [Ignavibacteriales bacterium]MCB9258514.1 hypothetical protein [Ignavibacteriales bacterium]
MPEIEIGSEEIGKFYPQIKDNLKNALQLINDKNTFSSNQLIEAAFENVYDKTADLNFLEKIDYKELRTKFKIFATAIFFSLLLFFIVTPLKSGAIRIIQFNKDFSKPLEFSLTSITENQKIKKGENISIEILGEGKVPEDIKLSIKSLVDAEFKDFSVKPDSLNIFKHTLRNVKEPLVYFAYKNDIKTETFKVDVTSAPAIDFIDFEIIPPRYSKRPITSQENNGNIIALKGTKVNFNLSSTKELVSAYRNYGDNKFDSLKVNGNNVEGSFTISDKTNYFFSLKDIDGNENENPISYSIDIIQDEFPQIDIIRPEQISLIPNNDIVSISYKINDDYGFSNVQLNFNTSDQASQIISDQFKNVKLNFSKDEIEQFLYFNWDVSTLGLRENEVVNFYLEVADNDNVSGPKISNTSIYKLRVPSLNELFAQAENTQENAALDLEKTLKEAADLQKELKQISDELKQNEQEIDWNEKERVEESIKKFEELTSKVDEIQKNLDDMRKQMTENNLLSEETMQKYNELQDLMDELNSEELKKAMENMQKSLEQLMRDKVQQSMENLSMNEEMFQKSIERTLNLLKKIQIEQKMDEVIKRTEKIIEDLEKLSSETEKNSKEQDQTENQKLANEQKDIENQLNSLEKEMEKLQDKMSEVNDMPSEKMEKMNKEFDEQKNSELSKQAMEQLQEQNPFDALKKQQQMSQNMNSMMSQMQQLQQQMQQQNQQMVMQNMLKAIDNIIDLSKDQEEMSNSTKDLLSQPKELPNQAENQMEIKQNLDKILRQLGDLSQKTFAITPEMGEALGKARTNMDQAISGMQNRNGQQSNFNQGEAMKNLNEAASLLQNSLQAMMQGGGQGGGMMSLMQQLQQMAQQQMGLNKMTQMMKQGQLTMQQQAQLQRLAQEQAAIQKSLAELNKEAKESGESKKLAADLDKVLSEMKEVVSGMNTKKIDDELIKKQERILSKLLDAQSSINDRDFEKNRESFSGKEFNLESPEELILSNERTKDLLREELLKSFKEGYSKDYEDLIRRYFETLNENKN